MQHLHWIFGMKNHLAPNLILTPLTPAYLDEVLTIAEVQLGQGYVTPQILAQHCDHPDYFGQLVLLEGQVAGFSLMQVSLRTTIAQQMGRLEGWFNAYFGAYETMGFRSVTAVAPSAQGRGVGGLLVQKGLQWLSTRVPVVVCDAWHAPHTPIVRLLTRHGYRLIRTVPHFWSDSDTRCPVCGPPPCQCTAGIYACFFDPVPQPYWWERDDLQHHPTTGHLHLAGHSLLALAQRQPTPFYVYALPRLLDNYQRLDRALTTQGMPYRIYYAMKANHHPAILAHLKTQTQAGIDVCSPQELQHALAHGFEPPELTYTGTALSNRDLQAIAAYPDMALNLDALSAIRRFATLNQEPRDIGIRINPDLGMAYRSDLTYAGQHTVKFGVYETEWDELQALVATTSLRVVRVHCHVGSGFLSDQLERLPALQASLERFLALFPTVTELNVGGGLGVPQQEGDLPLDLSTWAGHWGAFCQKHDLRLVVEPGDYLVKDIGVLITQVNSLEHKQGELFVGLDVGMNVNYEAAYYDMNLEPVPLQRPVDGQLLYGHLAGNINEPIDLLARHRQLPPVQEGDYLALLNAGGYGASTSSNHCLRGDFGEYVLYPPSSKNCS